MMWQCTICTLANPESALFCSGCGGRRTYAEPQGWYCGTCRHANAAVSRFCEQCGAPSAHSSGVGVVNSVLQPVSYSQGRPTPDFTAKAVITAVLYAVLWLPGVIANTLWWLEAKKVKERIGSSPSGYGCLLWMFILFVGLPLALLAVLLLVLLLAGISLTGFLASHGLH
jgi:Zn-finger in Ran binding protein and others